MTPQKLIESINKNLGNFTDDFFKLSPSTYNALSYVLEGTSCALNRFSNDTKEVKVVKWFDDFWLYLEIRFRNEVIGRKSQINILVSLSVFQGEDSDNKKYQLFRAEWDDYNNPSEKHAQPHWHITSSQAIEDTFVKYAEDFEQQDFLQMLEDEKQKIFDVKKIHFAMNADWQGIKGEYIHKMTDEQQVVKWLQGMLAYLRDELENS